MTNEFDPIECTRLIAEALEDDEKLSAAPWSSCNGDRAVVDADGELVSGLLSPSENHARIARSRNNLRSMATQLELACYEVAKRTDERDVARWADDTRRKASEALITELNAVRDRYISGSLTQLEAILAARNVGVDITCGECASHFYTGHSSAPHDQTCKTERSVKGLTSDEKIALDWTRRHLRANWSVSEAHQAAAAIDRVLSGATDRTELDMLRESVGILKSECERMEKLARALRFDESLREL